MHQYSGKLILHTGSMFSGKTSSLWKDLNRFRIAKYNVAAFKPTTDTRDGLHRIRTHDRTEMQCTPISSMEEVLEAARIEPMEVIGIDEVQFLQDHPTEIVKAIQELLDMDKTVVLAGLDMDFTGTPFEVVKELMPICDYLTKHHAVCANCGVDAWVSYRKSKERDRVVIGAQQEYEPLCRKCFKMKEEERLARENQMEFLSETEKA